MFTLNTPVHVNIVLVHLKGFGLRNEDTMKSFANMIKRNIFQPSDESPEFAYTPNESKNLLWNGLQRVMFNTIFMILHDHLKLNETDYAITYSRKLSCKIWVLVNDWELLLIWNLAYRNEKQVLTDIVISREIHNKNVIRYLNKRNVYISYEDISRQNRK